MKKKISILILFFFSLLLFSNNDTLNVSDIVNSIPNTNKEEIYIILKNDKNLYDYINIIIPILTLVLGIVIKSILDKISERKRIKKTGQRWVAELRNLNEPLNKQIENLNIILKEFSKEQFKPPNLEIYSILNGNLFKTLNKNDFLEYIKIKNKSKKFNYTINISNKIYSYLDILSYLHKTLKEKYELYINKVSNYTELLSINLQNFNKTLGETSIFEECNNNDEYKTIIELYKKHFIPYQKESNFNPFILKKELFIPIIEIHSRNQDNEIGKIVSHITNALNNIKGIELENTYLTTNLSSIRDEYISLKSDLDNIIKNNL